MLDGVQELIYVFVCNIRECTSQILSEAMDWGIYGQNRNMKGKLVKRRSDEGK